MMVCFKVVLKINHHLGREIFPFFMNFGGLGQPFPRTTVSSQLPKILGEVFKFFGENFTFIAVQLHDYIIRFRYI
jgi:hypothetical protein